MGALLTTQSVLQCPHGGSVSTSTSNTKARADGAFVLRKGDTFSITGCTFVLASSPHPCTEVQWLVAALRVKVADDDVLTADSVGLCVASDKAPQGTVLVQSSQSKVKAT